MLPGIGRSKEHHLISRLALLCVCLTRHPASGCQPGILSAVPLCHDADSCLIKCLRQRLISRAQAPGSREGIENIALAMLLAPVAGMFKGSLLLGQSGEAHGMCQNIDSI